MICDYAATTCALFSSKFLLHGLCIPSTYGRWKIHGLVVNTNLQRRWENMSLASSLPITLTDGAVMGRYWRMHITSNLISCLKSERESGSSCGNNDIILYVHLVTQPNQASRGWMFLKILSQITGFSMFIAAFWIFLFLICALFRYQFQSATKQEIFFFCQLTQTCRNTLINTHREATDVPN